MIVWPDAVNGCYELLGAPFIGLSVMKLYKEKVVRGVSWLAVAFFASWGYWNMFYYSNLHQWCSFAGGLCIVTVNTIWLGQMLYYINKEKHDTTRSHKTKGSQQK